MTDVKVKWVVLSLVEQTALPVDVSGAGGFGWQFWLPAGWATSVHMRVKQLVDRGEQVVNLDNLVYGHTEAACGSEVVIGDIGNRDLLRQVFTTHDIDAVMHFAAFAAVGESVADPQKGPSQQHLEEPCNA